MMDVDSSHNLLRILKNSRFKVNMTAQAGEGGGEEGGGRVYLAGDGAVSPEFGVQNDLARCYTKLRQQGFGSRSGSALDLHFCESLNSDTHFWSHWISIWICILIRIQVIFVYFFTKETQFYLKKIKPWIHIRKYFKP